MSSVGAIVSNVKLKSNDELTLPAKSVATKLTVCDPSALPSVASDGVNEYWPNELYETATGAPPSTEAVSDCTPDKLSSTWPVMVGLVFDA